MTPSSPDTLSVHNSEALARLERALAYADGFALYYLVCPSDDLRRDITGRLRRSLAERGAVLADVELPAGCTDPLEEIAARAPEGAAAVSVVGLAQCGSEFGRAAMRMNLQRERWAELLHVPVLLWMDRETLETLTEKAPDFTAWTRGGEEFTAIGEDRHLTALRKLLADLRGARPTPQTEESILRVARSIHRLLLEAGQSAEAADLAREMERRSKAVGREW